MLIWTHVTKPRVVVIFLIFLANACTLGYTQFGPYQAIDGRLSNELGTDLFFKQVCEIQKLGYNIQSSKLELAKNSLRATDFLAIPYSGPIYVQENPLRLFLQDLYEGDRHYLDPVEIRKGLPARTTAESIELVLNDQNLTIAIKIDLNKYRKGDQIEVRDDHED